MTTVFDPVAIAVAVDMFDPPAVPLVSRFVPLRPPWNGPHPPQRAFLELDDVQEVGYGGSAGGGKSDALLMAALRYADVPGYAALVLRKTYTDLALPGAIMDRAKSWLAGTEARWNDTQKQFTFRSGATLTFGYLQTANDRYRYQSAEFQFIGFDELTQFDEVDYRYLFSRLRKPAHGPLAKVPLRMRGATNPGGRGHRWFKRRFIDKQCAPDDPEDTPEKAEARIFVPARLDDNPAVDRDAYLLQLAALDPQTRAMLLDGDWNAREPGDWVFPAGLEQVFALGAEHDRRLAAGTMPPPAGGALVVAADWGVHAHLLLLWPLEAGGFYVPREFVYEHGPASSIRVIAPAVVKAINELGYPAYRERFDASQPVLNKVFLDHLNELLSWKVKFTGVPFNAYKADTIDYLRWLVANVMTGATPPHLSVSERGCPVLADQMRGWIYKDVDLGLIDKHDDHGPDALVAGAAPEAAKRRKKKLPGR